MSYLVRCPSCLELPDGSIERCRWPKRVDAGEIDPRVGCPRSRCPRCAVPYATWPPPVDAIPRVGEASEDWG